MIQGDTGAIAEEQIQLLALDPDVERVGACVFRDEKVGEDVGEIAGLAP
jgi:hypothetical protein